MRIINYILIIIIAAAMGCRKPYLPPAITSAASYLVVEGVINAGSDSTIINLSRTVNLSAKTAVNLQKKAAVTVESDQNGIFKLTEITPGKYISTGLNLDNTRQYRLRIITPDNKQYLSDFVPVNVTPPIDSIGFNVVGDNLQIYANAHDPNNATHYYRWDFAETWRFHAKYDSGFVTDGTAIVNRDPATQQIYFCYTGDESIGIILGNTTALGQDVVYQAPITLIPSTSEKIETRYSILLHQYALTGDAYNFWLNIKKNTEQLGSIFDAQPSVIAGNIHNIANPSEIVVGYISVSTVQSKRTFIDISQLPRTWVPTYPYSCTMDTIWFKQPGRGANMVAQLLIPLTSAEIPLFPFWVPPNSSPAPPDGYISSDLVCVDCRARGGNIVPPPFWK